MTRVIRLRAVVAARMVEWLWRWWMRRWWFRSRWPRSWWTWRWWVRVFTTELELKELVKVTEFLIGAYEGRLDDR